MDWRANRCRGLERRRRTLDLPSRQVSRYRAQLGAQPLAAGARGDVRLHCGGLLDRQLSVEILHQFVWTERMFNGRHGVTLTRSSAGRSSIALSAIRARNSRERTVLSGSSLSSAISA